MSFLLDPSEILQFAIRIEENGEIFYNEMAKKCSEPEVKEIFSFLGEEEVAHKNTFSKMVSQIEKYEPFENYPGEYFAYLRAYADNIIFTKEKMEEKISQLTDDSVAALEFAMGAEQDTILYYQDIKKLVPENHHDKIDAIIDEERRHFVKLAEMKKSLT
jgi:rubrerythrin